MTPTQPARYWIAQHIQDLFRKEPCNVGVILQVNGLTLTRFLGEKEDGRIDGRIIRGLAHPRVFLQWVEFWREACAEEGHVDPQALSGHHYRVIEGGALAGHDVSNPAHMLDYLFSALVSPEGAAAALMMDMEREDATAREHLNLAIEATFHSIGLLEGDDPLHFKYPIRQHMRIQGEALTHAPSFSQRNGKLYVMEYVDFTHRQRQRMSDLAGRTAYMFSDLHKSNQALETITLIHVDDDAASDAIISYGLDMLRHESDKIVNWFDEDERASFIQERVAIATGEPS